MTNPYMSINRRIIEQYLQPQQIKIMKTLSLAMIIGPFIFLAIITYLFVYKPVTAVGDEQLVMTFVKVIIIFALLSYLNLFFILPRILLKPANIRKNLLKSGYRTDETQPHRLVEGLVVFDRIYMIIRLATFEGITLFALVNLFLSYQGGMLYKEPLLWLLALPWLIQFYFTRINYFSKEKMFDRMMELSAILSRNKDDGIG